MQDIRYSIRLFARNPGFAATAVFTLALAIGGNTTMFTVLNAVVLRNLPYPDADRLAVIWVDFGDKGQSLPSVSALDFRDFPTMSTTFEGFAAGRGSTANLTGAGEPELVKLGRVTHNFFPILGVEPVLGRSFLPSEDVSNGPDVVLLSDGLWKRRFGSDPSIVGSTVQVDGTNRVVVGVMPESFTLLLPSEAFLEDADLWAPLQDPYQGPRNRTLLTVIGRLAAGTSFVQAQADMDAVAARLRDEHLVHSRSDTRIRIVPLHEDVVKSLRPALLALFGAVGLVLLIACSNVANLLLARAASRQREIAVRASLGADRRRLVRQMVTESAMLSLAACAVGLLLALWGTDLLVAFQPTHWIRLADVRVDGAGFAFAAGACLLTVLLCGVVPALRASRPGVFSLRDGGSGQGSPSLRRALVAGEVTLSLVLLIGFSLLLRSFILLQDVRPGFDPESVLTFRLSLAPDRYRSSHDRVLFHEALRERLESIPGVRIAGAVSQMPLTGAGSQAPYAYDEETEQNWESVTTDVRTVTESYFPTAGIQLKAGRMFDERDGSDGRLVVIVDEVLAAKAWPGQDAVGKRLKLPVIAADGVRREWFDVVGIVEHVRLHDLTRDGREQVYFPIRERPPRTMDILLRTESGTDPSMFTELAARSVHAIDPDLPVHAPLPMSAYLTRSMAQLRFTTLLGAIFGAFALLLATIALYGLISYSVSQRRRELGIRRALGAGEAGILTLVMGEGLFLTLIGIAVGFPIALLAARALSSMLYGVGAADPLTFLGVSGTLAAVSLIACYFPASRAIRASPLLALRHE